MTKKIFLGVFLLFIFAGQFLKAQDEQAQFLRSFLAGQYSIIGRWCDTDSTYRGTVTVSIKNETTATPKKSTALNQSALHILRTIGGKTIEAVGRIENATADNVKVLRIRFNQDGQQYEGTFLIASDLDNYARLSGYIYLQNGMTKQPGLEAWFISHRTAR